MSRCKLWGVTPVEDIRRCPKCGHQPALGEECPACGVVYAKWRPPGERPTALARAEAPKAKPAAASAPGTSWGGFARAELGTFCTSLAELLEAGVSVHESLALIRSSTTRRLRALAEGLGTRIAAGDGLADALGGYPGAFSLADVEVVRAGERTGRVAEALRTVAAEQEAAIRVRRRLWKGAAYPLTVLGLSIVIGPIPELVLGSAQGYLLGVVGHLAAVGTAMAAIVVGIPWLLSRSAIGHPVRRALWRLPWPATLYVHRVRASFGMTLGRNLAAGLPVFAALRSAGQATGDPRAAEAAGTACDAVERGAGLADALAPSGLAAPEDLLLVHTGERSGSLEASLERVRALASDRYARGLNRLLSLVGVLFTLVVFLYVALGVLGAYEQVTAAVKGPLDEIERELHKLMPPSGDLERELDRMLGPR
jgi:type II secretory pathway component PulF